MALLKRAMSRRTKNVKEDAERDNKVSMQKKAGSASASRSASEAKPEVQDEWKSRVERPHSNPDRTKSVDVRNSEERPRTAPRSRTLEVVGQRIDIEQGGDTFSFPTPSPLIPPRSATIHSTSSSLRVVDSSDIGKETDSPANVPATRERSQTFANVGTPSQKQVPPVRAFTALPVRPEQTKKPELRRKRSGWQTFGGLFQRRAAKLEIDEPSHQVHAETQSKLVPQLQASSASPPSVPMKIPNSISSHHARMPSLSRGQARVEARAEADKSSFVPPVEGKMTRSRSINIKRQSVLQQRRKLAEQAQDLKAMLKTQPTDNRQSQTAAKNNVESVAVPRTPRLDLIIPNGDMERYSVMFEKLLEPRQSIIERRQSKAKRLYSRECKDELATIAPPVPSEQVNTDTTSQSKLPQRSMTSPHLNKIPSLRIRTGSAASKEPETTKPMAATLRPRPVQRSKTAPVESISLVSRNFSRPATMKAPALISSESEASPSSPLTGENSLPPTPSTITSYADGEEVQVFDHDPPVSTLRRKTSHELSWDLLTAQSAAQVKGRHLYPRVKSPEDLERHMVQVSVARQVSVSRARKQVQQAVASKQPMRPRVVELSKNRKSTVVLIEGGDE